MRQIVVPFLAALVGGGVGAFAAAHWMPGARSASSGPTADSGSASDDVRDQLRELKALLERPRELAAPPVVWSGPKSGAGPASGAPGSVGTEVGTAASPSLAATIQEAVAAGIAQARAKDPKAFGTPAPEPAKRATLAEIARDLQLSSSQEDEIRRAYSDSTEKFLKLIAEPESTPDAIRRELEDAKNDSGKRSMLMIKYMPKMITKLGEVMSVQTERDQRIHKALGAENVPKFEKYKVAEEDPFGLDGPSIDISAGITDK